MFNVTGGEIIILLLVALIVLGPEKLPDAIRRFGQFYGEFKRMSTGFQSELRSALDEPMREMRETANLAKGIFEEPANEIRSSGEALTKSANEVKDIFAGKANSASWTTEAAAIGTDGESSGEPEEFDDDVFASAGANAMGADHGDSSALTADTVDEAVSSEATGGADTAGDTSTSAESSPE